MREEAGRRRFVTALFCDLVGSTELAERLDPEALRKTLDAYFAVVRAAIERHGGVVEKFIGDAVVGVFGVPAAHEDDPLRAVRAALEMREEAARVSVDDEPVRVRIAIDAGEAFGDGSAALEGRIGGDVFNTAARLQSAAEAGQVIISGRAERLARGAVLTEAIDPLTLKGKAHPVVASRVIGIEAEPARSDTPMVGRARALATIEGALEDAVESGACVLVTVLAPPGVGKSRLASAFADAVGDRAKVLVAQTPSYGEGVTFAPLVDLLAAAAGVTRAEGETIAAALRTRLAGRPDGATVADRLAQVLGVGQASAAEASWAVRRLLETLAEECPLVVVLEDVHWAEGPMLDLVDAAVERFHGPAVVMCLARPELLEQRPTWASGKSRSITTTLPPLTAGDARRLAEHHLGGAPAAVIDRVCETVEGNPLFLEHVTAMLGDRGLVAGDRWVGGANVDVEIPTTVQALLASRLDRLDPIPRLVLERASIEGRRFRTEVVRSLSPDLTAQQVGAALETLNAKGLVHAEDATNGRWRCEHALIVEAAYRGLSKEIRATLHERLADRILREDADQPDADESAARHLERSLRLREELGDRATEALAERAGALFADAGERAFAALDLITAGDLLGRAAALLPEDSPRRLDILPNLGVALSETGRPAETEALLSAAVEQARASGSRRDELRARVQLLSNHVYRSPTEAEVRAAAAEAKDAALTLEAMGDDVGLAEAAIAVDYLAWMLGDSEGYREWALRGLRHALVAGQAREGAQGASDLVLAAGMGALPFDAFGPLTDELAVMGAHPLPTSVSLALSAMVALAEGDRSAYAKLESEWHEVLEHHGMPWLEATHALVIAGIETWAGEAERAERRLREARDVLAAVGDIWWVGTLDALLGAALAAQGDDRGFLTLADAFTESDLVPDPDTSARRELIRSHALLLRGSPADAEAAARGGLAIAERGTLPITSAEAYVTLARALEARGLEGDAADARGHAVELLRRKGHRSAVERMTNANDEPRAY